MKKIKTAEKSTAQNSRNHQSKDTQKLINKVFDAIRHNEKEGTCCICGAHYSDYGHNAMPYAKGRCCGKCNSEKVIPTRLFLVQPGIDFTSLNKPNYE